MNTVMVMNEFGVSVHDIFAEWLMTNELGTLYDPNPIHNAVAIDIFAIALCGVINE